MAKPMQDEPCGFLRDPQVGRQRGRGDALLVIGDKPDRAEPNAKRKFRVLKNRPDRNREILAALCAPELVLFRQRINAVMPAMRAELAVFPTDRREVVNCPLWLLKG